MSDRRQIVRQVFSSAQIPLVPRIALVRELVRQIAGPCGEHALGLPGFDQCLTKHGGRERQVGDELFVSAAA